MKIRPDLLRSRRIINILLRDDDVCYFTNPAMFQTVHCLLIEKQIPFNVAVVPEQQSRYDN